MSKFVDEAMALADGACDAAWGGGAAWDYPNLYRRDVERRDNKLEALRTLLTAREALLDRLAEALDASPHGLHSQVGSDGPCRCSQCKFVGLRDAALTLARTNGVGK